LESNRSFSQVILHVFFILLSLFCVLPFILLFVTSITSENEIVQNGYTFFPAHFSLEAYKLLWNQSEIMLRAYGITILVTVIGTAGSLAITSLFAYPLSRRELPGRGYLSFFVFITMLFNGGLVPTYLVYTQLLDLKNTIWALIIPGHLMSGFFVIMVRTFFTTTIPFGIIESAHMDGASEFKIYYRLILPLSLPILATVGLFSTIGYWNDWFNGLIYITDSHLYGVQNLLNRMLLDVQFLNNSAEAGMASVRSSKAFMLPTETFRMAIAVVGVLPILALYPFFQKFFIQGLVVGSVKG